MKNQQFLRTCLLLCCLTSVAQAQQVWNLSGAGTWNLDVNWNPSGIPNSTGASALFNGADNGSNPAQTANRIITLDVAQTIGSLFFNNDVSFTNTLAVGTAGSLIFDETDAGPATITTFGFGTGNNTISAAMTLTDTVVAVVANTSATSAAGSLNLTGAISGPGGFIKQGDGTATFGTAAKTYLGSTELSGGRMRISVTGAPTLSSSFTIDAGAQLELLTAGTYSLGSGVLNLNGTGASGGPNVGFPGAIRPTTGLAQTITNAINLQTDTLIHVQGAAAGALTLSGSISGVGGLTFGALPFNADLGRLIFGNDNSYLGGTFIQGGTISLATSNADLGNGDVTVLSANAQFAGAAAKLQITTGVLDAIADTATLSLAGGRTFDVADDGYVELQAGVNEFVGALILGGVSEPVGTYGSTASTADFQSDEYFSGEGIVTVVPEPGAAVVLLGGFGALLGLQRKRSRR
jgi:autotransporter-associated beta strand protein